MKKSLLSFLLLALSFISTSVFAATFTVTNLQDSGPGSLREAMLGANGASPSLQLIDATGVTGTITLASSLPIITAQNLTIAGPGVNNLTIDGAHQYRVFFVGVSVDAAYGSIYTTTNGQLMIEGLTVANGMAKGGDAGVNAGGGAGLGAGLFINAGSVLISNVTFTGNLALGGAGGVGTGSITNAGGGGGGLGGMGGNGGFTTNGSWGGGGGGFGYGATGGSAGSGTGSGDFSGAASGGFGGGGGTPGGINGGGGFGPPSSANGYAGGGGGVNGGAGQGYFDYTVFPAAWHAAGGNAGFGGGGGGGGGYQFDGNANGGNGGFGGGGGAGQQRNYGGNGGFGGGAGSGFWPGTPGFGGGNATNQINFASGGGGGVGAGGAIFVRKGTSLTVIDCSFSGNVVTGGIGGVDGAIAGSAGSAIGQALFLGADVTNSVCGTNVVILSDTIGGGNDPDAGGGLVKIGNGTLVLTGTNSYTGLTTLAAGTLEVDGSIAAGGTLTVNTGATLTGSGAVGELTINTGSTLSPGPGIAALNAGDVAWKGIGTYNWQMYDAAGAAGAGYDVLNVNGTLDLTSTTSITINVMSLSSIAPETSGPATNFNNTVSHSWTLIHTTDGIIRFNASKFNIVTNGFLNSLGSGRFVLQVMGTDLVLSLVSPLSVVTQPATSIVTEKVTATGIVADLMCRLMPTTLATPRV